MFSSRLSIEMICLVYSLIVIVGGSLGQEDLDRESGFLTKSDKFLPSSSSYQQQENIFQIVDDNYISMTWLDLQFAVDKDKPHLVLMHM